MKELSVAERRQEILGRASQAGRVAVAELSHEFGVSEVTIRYDLQALAEGNLMCAPTAARSPQPPAYPSSPSASACGSRSNRRPTSGPQPHGSWPTVMPSSSTAAARPSARPEPQGASLCHRHHQRPGRRPGVAGRAGRHGRVIGGTLRKDTASIVSTGGLDMLRRFNIRKGFFGAHGGQPGGRPDRCERGGGGDQATAGCDVPRGCGRVRCHHKWAGSGWPRLPMSRRLPASSPTPMPRQNWWPKSARPGWKLSRFECIHSIRRTK